MHIHIFYIVNVLKHFLSVIGSNAEHDARAAARRRFCKDSPLSRPAEYQHCITATVYAAGLATALCPSVLNITARRNEPAADNTRDRIPDKYSHKHISLRLTQLAERHYLSYFAVAPYIVNYPARRLVAAPLHYDIASFSQMLASFLRPRIIQRYHKITVSRAAQPLFYDIPRRQQVAQTYHRKII